MNRFRIIISGGGTGGHIFPALAIASAIEEKVTDVEFLFVGAKDRMEMQKIPNAGYNIIGLWISGLQRSISIRNILFPVKVLHSIYEARKIIKEFKPDLAIGTGGYASAPLLYVAAKLGIPSLIQEQNSYAGITNRVLGRYVDRICVAYDNMERFFPSEKMILTGNPIRNSILRFQNKKDQAEYLFDIDTSKPTVLIVGGSLGALSINNAIAEDIDRLENLGINIIWQTGLSYYEKAKSFVYASGAQCIKVYSFIKEMDKAYAAADIIVSRSGAIAIAELCCVGKPVILVPSPYVAENHQYKNAQSLVNKNAALLVEDAKSNCKLVDVIIDLLQDEDLKCNLVDNIKNIAVKDAADRIATAALSLVK